MRLHRKANGRSQLFDFKINDFVLVALKDCEHLFHQADSNSQLRIAPTLKGFVRGFYRGINIFFINFVKVVCHYISPKL